MLLSNPMKLIAVAAVALALAACGNNATRDSEIMKTFVESNFTRDIDAVRASAPAGADFNGALAREYKTLMLFEADQMYDYVSALMYAKRSLAAARGETVTPLDPKRFNEPAAAMPSLTESRGQMIALFEAGARQKIPAKAAELQASFDCWVEQQEENHQPDHIAACRNKFVKNLAELREAMKPAPVAAAPAPVFKESYTILFDFDSATLTPAARATLTEVVNALRAQNAGASIIGHTDTSGSKNYNQTLSERRAKAVADLILEAGIRPAVVTAEGRGEADLATPTPDNVRNPANRRAVISIR